MTLSRRERNRRHEIRKVLYRLERRYRLPADLYVTNQSAIDVETGEVTETVTKYPLPRFISFEVKNLAKFEYDLGYTAANRNFTYGGVFEIGDRIGIIRDVDSIDKDNYIVFDNKRYNIERFVELDCQAGFMVHMRHTVDQPMKRIWERTVIQYLTLEQTVESEL